MIGVFEPSPKDKKHIWHLRKGQGGHLGSALLLAPRIIGLFIAGPNYHKQAHYGRGDPHNGGVKAAKVVAS